LELQRSLLGTEALHRLMFSTLMLNQWLRSGHQMSLSEWTQLNVGIECNGNDVPVHLQTAIHKVLTEGHPTLGGVSATAAKRARCIDGDSQPLKAAANAKMESWAHVRYSGRAQMGQGSDTAVWPSATPRYLAASGGVMSAGRSAPTPGPAVKSHEVAEMLRAATAASSLRSANIEEACAPSRSVAVSPLTMSRPLDGGVVGGGPSTAVGEAAWLSLRGWILLLSTVTDDVTPYGFVSLRHALIKEADPGARRIVLGNRSDHTWQPLANGDEDWLDLCLLLGDGRFQAMEAPELEIRCSKMTDYEQWKICLEEVCSDTKANAEEIRVPGFLQSSANPGGHDDSTASSVPPWHGEKCLAAEDCDAESDAGDVENVASAQQIPVLR